MKLKIQVIKIIIISNKLIKIKLHHFIIQDIIKMILRILINLGTYQVLNIIHYIKVVHKEVLIILIKINIKAIKAEINLNISNHNQRESYKIKIIKQSACLIINKNQIPNI